MNTTLCRVLGSIVLMSLVGSPAVSGQTVSSVEGSDDRIWNGLREASLPRSFEIPAGAGDSAVAHARQMQADEYLRQADELRAYRLAATEEDRQREAKRLEALLLLYAANEGDDTAQARRDALVEEVRVDASIPAAERYEVTVRAENLKVARNAALNVDQRLAALEQVSRGLITEFPDVDQGYEALLAVAYARSERAAADAATELAGNPNAPLWVQQRAHVVLNRQALVGKPIDQYVALVPEAAKAVAALQGRPFLVYGWATWHEGSVALARELAVNIPPGVGLLGVNLDTDVTEAQTAAKVERLDERQLYHPDGPSSQIALGVTLTTPGMVFFIDAEGVVVSTSAHRDLAGVLTGLAQQ